VSVSELVEPLTSTDQHSHTLYCTVMRVIKRSSPLEISSRRRIHGWRSQCKVRSCNWIRLFCGLSAHDCMLLLYPPWCGAGARKLSPTLKLSDPRKLLPPTKSIILRIDSDRTAGWLLFRRRQYTAPATTANRATAPTRVPAIIHALVLLDIPFGLGPVYVCKTSVNIS